MLTPTSQTKRAHTFIELIPALTAVLGAFAVLVATAYRLRFGLHFTDESCYIVRPFRSVLGDRPLVDDLDIKQPSTLLLYPFIALYLRLNAGTEGIVLFTRILYLGYAVVIGLTVFSALKARIPWIAALFTSLLCVAYTHFNIYNLSYNTMGSGFLVAGVFLGLRGLVEGGRQGRLYLALSGLAHGLAVVAYPPFAIVGLLFTVALARSAPVPKLSHLVAFGTGAGGVILVSSWFVLHAGIGNLVRAVEFSAAYHREWGSEAFGSMKKISLILSQLRLTAPMAGCVGGALIAAVSSSRVLPSLSLCLAPLLVLLSFRSGLPDYYPVSVVPMGFVICFSLTAPVFAAALWNDQFVRMAFSVGWLPSFVAGLLSAWTSTNGLPNAAVGLFPATLVTCALVVLWASQLAEATRFPSIRGLRVLAPVLAVACVVYSQYVGRAVYGDEPIPKLTAKVTTGPFRGIFTTPQKASLLEQLASDLPTVVNPAGRILAYPDFAAGYLMTTMRPASPHCWVGRTLARHPKWYGERASPSNVVVRLKNAGEDLALLDKVVWRHHRVVIDRPDYYVLTGSPRRARGASGPDQGALGSGKYRGQ